MNLILPYFGLKNRGVSYFETTYLGSGNWECCNSFGVGIPMLIKFTNSKNQICKFLKQKKVLTGSKIFLILSRAFSNCLVKLFREIEQGAYPSSSKSGGGKMALKLKGKSIWGHFFNSFTLKKGLFLESLKIFYEDFFIFGPI